MSWLSRRGALSRLAQHFDHHLHDHHAASYYSLFKPTTFTNYTLTPFHNSPAEDLFRQFQPASFNRLFTLWDNPWQEGEKESNNTKQQQSNNSRENKDNVTTNSSSSGNNFNNSLQSHRSSSSSSSSSRHHQHHLHRYRSHHHRQPFDAIANFWSPFVSFPIPSVVPSITLNVYSTPTSYQIQAELPGVKKEEIVISVEKGTLTIEAEKKEERGNRPNTSNVNTANASANTNNDINNSNNVPNVKLANAQKENTNNSTSNDSSPSASSTSSSSSSSTTSPPSTSSSSSLSDSNGNDVEDLYVESHYGRVSRSVSLPDDAALDGLIAKYEDGVIKIEIPRRQISKEEKKIVQLQ